MPYTLWSTEGLLGDTELDFVWRDDRRRVGFLDPTELGEILLGIPPGSPIGMPYPCDSLTLELRDDQGAVIPTEEIFVRDVEYVMSLVEAQQPEPELTEEELEEMQQEFEEEVSLLGGSHDLDEALFDRAQDRPPRQEWTRFQIHVRLVDDASIP